MKKSVMSLSFALSFLLTPLVFAQDADKSSSSQSNNSAIINRDAGSDTVVNQDNSDYDVPEDTATEPEINAQGNTVTNSEVY